ncbi:hypothetical protein [Pseudoalteromonas sp. MMG012]|uniref:hypothetical protein n=1 Tax=Pseudoalteromonas sp. MMG012 TaxID=2822686 RepID=UPI001B3A3C46|nr:hypothetical protein [Pseudoalteromonas sp. MMG012]MBQ4849918.1 hypothetical protein [Pseudoalteromonas sp. MMG012]
MSILVGFLLAMITVGIGLSTFLKQTHSMPPVLFLLCGSDFLYGLLLNIFNPKAYAPLITILTPVVIPIKSTKEQPFGIILLMLLCLAVVAHIYTAWLLAGAKLGDATQKPPTGAVAQ